MLTIMQLPSWITRNPGLKPSLSLYFDYVISRQDFIDYSHRVVEMYEALWKNQSLVAEAHLHDWTIFQLASFVLGSDTDEQYSADIVKYLDESGLRVTIYEYPPVPELITGIQIQQEPRGEAEVIDDQFYPSLRLSHLAAEDDAEDVDGDESNSNAATLGSTEEDEEHLSDYQYRIGATV
jgi:hypothetical protein